MAEKRPVKSKDKTTVGRAKDSPDQTGMHSYARKHGTDTSLITLPESEPSTPDSKRSRPEPTLAEVQDNIVKILVEKMSQNTAVLNQEIKQNRECVNSLKEATEYLFKELKDVKADISNMKTMGEDHQKRITELEDKLNEKERSSPNLTTKDKEARNKLWPQIDAAHKEGKRAFYVGSFSFFYGAKAIIDGKERQYHFISENKTWTEAQSYCREKYTDLATVDNMNDMNELNKTLKYGGLQYVWIGLQRKWQWSSGEPALYLNWGFAQPDGRDECAFMKNGKWEDGSCNDILTFICNSSNKDKLIVITENLTWSEALRYCRQNHVDLVSVHSEEIQRRVMNVVKQASTSAVWLGLRHSCTVGIWFWVSGETVCYQNWAPGNGTSEEDCEHTVRSGAVQSGGDQHWISRHETDKLNFICSRYE
ncbi:macrophage mannose receptor 1-like protein [Labeo rohita]|uniref:Macrophage mannose receptor 1-like protein n=1 Tax=Labeo rohita TaxID=84645 RepID=A0A498N5Z2_LABRO|nr:macrophage mannose receptor 1-like protein [Labeo rohita]